MQLHRTAPIVRCWRAQGATLDSARVLRVRAACARDERRGRARPQSSTRRGPGGAGLGRRARLRQPAARTQLGAQLPHIQRALALLPAQLPRATQVPPAQTLLVIIIT